ncbi:hypothetical protein J6590_035425 [Homalodisca vitripennis]|nr:hypothetical protein J6590_035425 [Homalodisca vitripennis]
MTCQTLHREKTPLNTPSARVQYPARMEQLISCSITNGSNTVCPAVHSVPGLNRFAHQFGLHYSEPI